MKFMIYSDFSSFFLITIYISNYILYHLFYFNHFFNYFYYKNILIFHKFIFLTFKKSIIYINEKYIIL